MCRVFAAPCERMQGGYEHSEFSSLRLSTERVRALSSAAWTARAPVVAGASATTAGLATRGRLGPMLGPQRLWLQGLLRVLWP